MLFPYVEDLSSPQRYSEHLDRTAYRPMNLRIGGETVEVFFHDAMIRFHPPGGSIDDYIEWPTEIGFLNHFRSAAWSAVHGQIGFFDQFTITMQRAALTLALEDAEAFDARFAPLIREAEEKRPRSLP